MPKRQRLKQTSTLPDRLAEHVKRLSEQASLMEPGSERDDALQKVQEAETAIHLNEWLTLPGHRKG